ncbi:MAG: 50S ribosomal protein L30e [Thermoprotei archaeon]|nr:MAG: 50S ribosomal protein L30e [Thermoprotei archaeon]
MVDVVRELKVALDTGKVVIGSKKTLKAAMYGKAKMIMIAANCPEDIRAKIEYYSKLSSIPIYVFPGSSWEIGAVCKKPFMVASLAIIDPGESSILALVESEGGE